MPSLFHHTTNSTTTPTHAQDTNSLSKSTAPVQDINSLILSKFVKTDNNTIKGGYHHNASTFHSNLDKIFSPQSKGSVTLYTDIKVWYEESNQYVNFPFIKLPLATVDYRIIYSNLDNNPDRNKAFIAIYPFIHSSNKYYYGIYEPVSIVFIKISPSTIDSIVAEKKKKVKNQNRDRIADLLIIDFINNNNKKILFVRNDNSEIAIKANDYSKIYTIKYTHDSYFMGIKTSSNVTSFINFVKPNDFMQNNNVYTALGITITDVDSNNVTDYIYIVNVNFTTESALNFSSPLATINTIGANNMNIYDTIVDKDSEMAFFILEGTITSTSNINNDFKKHNLLYINNIINNCSKASSDFYNNFNTNCVNYATNILPYDIFKLSPSIRDVCVKNKGMCDNLAIKYCAETDADKDFCACINAHSQISKDADSTEIELLNKPTCYLSTCINKGYQLKEQLDVSCPSLCVQKINFKALDKAQVSNTNINMNCAIDQTNVKTTVNDSTDNKPITTTTIDPNIKPTTTTIPITDQDTSSNQNQTSTSSSSATDKAVTSKNNYAILFIIIIISVIAITIAGVITYRIFLNKDKKNEQTGTNMPKVW